MTAEAHAEAVVALIGKTVRLHDGEVPDKPTLPYAVLYIGTGTAARTTLAAVSDRRDTTFQVTSVGLDAAGARSVAERVRTAVLDRRPEVPGRTSSPVEHVTAEPMRTDREVTPHRMYLVDRYTFSTVPA